MGLALNGRSIGIRSRTRLLAEGKVLRMLLEPLRRTCNAISIIKKTSVRFC